MAQTSCEEMLIKTNHSVNLSARTDKLFQKFTAIHSTTYRKATLIAVSVLDEKKQIHNMFVEHGAFKRELISEAEFRDLELIQEPVCKGVDLDGTLAIYSAKTLRDVYHIGKPIWPMVNLVKKWLVEGWKIKIFTARAGFGPSAIKCVQDWCVNVAGLPLLEVVCVKDGKMVCIYDDRCVQVEANTGRLLGKESGV